MSLINPSAISAYVYDREINDHSIHSRPDNNELLVRNIKVEQTENEVKEEDTYDHNHIDELVIEDLQVNKYETEQSSIDDQNNETQFVKEKIKLDDTDCFSRSNSDSPKQYYNPVTNDQHADEINKAYSKKPYKCNLCSESFHGISRLMRHKSKHVERPFKCADCKTCFHQSGSLKTHITLFCTGPTTTRRKNGSIKKFLPSKTPYVCSYCDRAYTSRSKLYRHVANCNLSKYTFIKDVKLFKCAGCGRCYRFVGQLEKHLSRECKKKSVRTNVKTLLNKNIADKELDPTDETEAQMWVIDAGDTPYKCARCDMSYSEPMQLKRHVYDHLKMIFPFTQKPPKYVAPTSPTRPRKKSIKTDKCDTCGLCFTSLCALNNHMKESQHKSRLYMCEDCGNRFLELKNLENHMVKYQHWTDLAALKLNLEHSTEQPVDMAYIENNQDVHHEPNSPYNFESDFDYRQELFFSGETYEELDRTTPEVDLNDIKEEEPDLDQYELIEQSLELLIHEDQPIKQEAPDTHYLLGD